MNLESALRVVAAINATLPALEDGSDEIIAALLARSIVEEELLAMGWRNDPADVPAMESAREWVAAELAK